VHAPESAWRVVSQAAQAYHVARLVNRPELMEPFKRHELADAGEKLARMVFEAPDQGHRSDIPAANRWAEELGG